MYEMLILTLPAGHTSQTSTRCNTMRNNIAFRVVEPALDLKVTVNITPSYTYSVSIAAGSSDWHHVNTMYNEHISFCIDLAEGCDSDTSFTIEYECVDRKCTNTVQLTDSDGKYLASRNGALQVEILNLDLDALARAVMMSSKALMSTQETTPAPAPAPAPASAPSFDNIVIDVPFKDLVVLGSRQVPLATDLSGHLLTKGENYTYSRVYNGVLTKGRLTPKVDCRNYIHKCVYCKVEPQAGEHYDREQYMVTLHVSPNGEDYYVLRQEVVGKSSVLTIAEPIGYLRLQIDDDVNVNIYISMY